MLVAKLPRARFIPIVNHLFVANLALFWLFLTLQIDTALVARPSHDSDRLHYFRMPYGERCRRNRKEQLSAPGF